MNPALQKAAGLAIKALWAALAALLARVAEPVLKWILFLALRGLVWILPDGRAEGAIKELYRELKESYGDRYDLDDPLGSHPKTPGRRGRGRGRFGGDYLDHAPEDREAGE